MNTTAYSYKYYGYHVAPQDKRPRKLNVGLLIVTLLLALVLGIGLYSWHRYQLRRLSVALLDRATSAEERGAWGEAAGFLFQYLGIQRAPEVIARLARDYDKSGADRNAVRAWYYRAIGLSANPTELRKRLAELLMDDQQYAQAREQARQVVSEHPTDVTARKWLALATHGEFQRGAPIAMDDVLLAINDARAAQPKDVDLAETLADLYRQNLAADSAADSEVAANEVMDALVREAATDPEAWLARYEYRRRYGIVGAEDDLNRVLELAPESMAGLAASAELALTRRDWPKAREHLVALAELLPSPEVFLKLGEAAYQLGQTDDAIELWQAASQRYSNDFGLASRLIEARLNLRQFGLAEALLRSAEDSQKRLLSTGNDASRSRLQAGLMLLWARWHLAQGERYAALPYLHRAVAAGVTVADGRQGNPLELVGYRLLGQTYGDLNQWERAVANYERALSLRPNDPATLLAAGDAWFRIGNVAQAARRCQQLVQQPDAAAESWLLLAEVELDRQSQVPFDQRDWTIFRSAFDEARRQLPDSWRLQVLEVDFRLLQQDPPDLPQVMSLLGGMEVTRPRDAQMWLGLSLAYQMLQQANDASRALDQYLTLMLPATQAWIAQADLATLRGNYDAALKILDSVRATESLGPSEQGFAVDVEMARVRVRLAEQPAQAQQILQQALLRFPERESLWELLLDHQLESGDRAALRLTLNRLQAAGDQQSFAESLAKYFDARTRIDELATETTNSEVPLVRASETTPSADGKLPSASEIHVNPDVASQLAWIESASRQLLTARPYWWRSFDLQARVALQSGHVNEAMEAWTDALQAGGNVPVVRREMLQLLWRERRIVDVARYVGVWTQRPTLARYFVLGPTGLAKQSQLADRELTRISHGNVGDPDPFSSIWLVVMRQFRHETAAASESLKRLTAARDTPRQSTPANDRDQVESWMASLILSKSNGSELETSWQALLASRFESEDDQLFIWGQAAEIAGHDEAAISYYERVADESIYGNPAASRRVDLLARMQQPKSPEDEAATSRSANALTLDVEQMEMRLRSLVGLRRGGRVDLVVARELLEGIVREPSGTSLDKALLAIVYDKQDQIAEAEALYERLVTEDDAAVYLADFVDFLLRRNKPDKAAPHLERLVRQTQVGPRILSLKGRFLVSQGREAEFIVELERYANSELAGRTDPNAITEHIRDIGWICQQTNQPSFVDKWFAAIGSRYPEALEPYTEHLVAHQATDQAVELCLDQLQTELSPQTAALLARTLVYGSPSTAIFARAEPIIRRAMERFPQDDRLLFAVANLELKQGDVEDSIELLRQVTTLNHAHYLAWNNLAVLLAERTGDKQESDDRDVGEALRCVDAALDVAGFGMLTLLDTKAVVLLRHDQHEEAMALLEQITATPLVDDPRYFFHLAIAADRTNRGDDAVSALARAAELDLASKFLTRVERLELRELQEKYDRELAAARKESR